MGILVSSKLLLSRLRFHKKSSFIVHDWEFKYAASLFQEYFQSLLYKYKNGINLQQSGEDTAVAREQPLSKN